MDSPEEKIKQLGLTLPASPSPVANYVPSVRSGNLLFLSGAGPAQAEYISLSGTTYGVRLNGKLGRDLSVEEGYKVAWLVGVSLLARLKEDLGDLGRVRRVVKLLAMVNSTPEFTEHLAVVNGCSDLLIEVFGDRGRHARSAVGMSSLPFDIPVEIEMVVEVSP